jgi:hypothetical protein
MQWRDFVESLGDRDRARLIQSLQDARIYSSLPTSADDRADVEWLVTCIDRAIDALAAARILLGAPAESQPWADETYRAFRSHHPSTVLRLQPAELSALRRTLSDRRAAAMQS